MTMTGGLSVSATLGTCNYKHPIRCSFTSPNSKFELIGFPNGASSRSYNTQRWPAFVIDSRKMHGPSTQLSGLAGNSEMSSTTTSQDTEGLLLTATRMNLFERLNLAWRITFPSLTQRRSSNARIAKQRLKMILFSDRCAVSDEAKQKIVKNIVHGISQFVEIESQEKVLLSVKTDSDLGTLCSVTVPVRRVMPGYQDGEETL